MNHSRILIVEDEGILAMALEGMLKKSGYTVLEPVATGKGAITAVEKEQPDLVLMDIQLSGNMDGITAAEQIRFFSDVPIVYLTGHSDEVMLERARLTRPYDYLIKPVLMNKLKRCLKTAFCRYDLSKKSAERP